MRFSCVFLSSFGAFSSPARVPQLFFGRLLVFLHCLCFSPVLGISPPCFILCVESACGSSFFFGALVQDINMRMPIALFACACLLLLLVAASVVARLLSFSVIPSFCYCCYLGVSIPSPCVSVLFRSVPLFPSRLIFPFGVWSVCSSLIGVIAQCHWCLLPCFLLCGNTSSVVLLPRSDLRFPSRCGLPLGRVRVCCILCLSWFSGLL